MIPDMFNLGLNGDWREQPLGFRFQTVYGPGVNNVFRPNWHIVEWETKDAPAIRDKSQLDRVIAEQSVRDIPEEEAGQLYMESLTPSERGAPLLTERL